MSEETDKNQPQDFSLFEKEIANLPSDLKQKLLSKKEQIDSFITKVKEKTPEKAMGFYVTPEFEQDKEGKYVPNFDKLILSFLFDDFEKPISYFDPKVLFQESFEDCLIEKREKDSTGQEYSLFYLKQDSSIAFEGTSISLLRENCFDSVYDDIKKLGSSFVVEDQRGFISALKSIDIHRNMLLQKFEKYVVVYAGAGSWLRGEKSNDFDVFVVVDDTDVKRMPRLQVKDQLTKIIWQMAQEVSQITGVHIHIQVYLLTDFWDALKDAHPVMFTFLRDGVPFYDRGLYNSWKELLKLGKIRPSPEAIDMHMNVANQLIDRANKTLNDIVINDVYYAVLNPAQAVLMLKGFNPTTPKETVKMFKDVLLSKEKIVTQKDVTILEETVKMFKKLEHDKDVKIKGKDVDSMLTDAQNFLKNMKKLFEKSAEQKTKDSVVSGYGELLTQIRTLPGYLDVAEKDLLDLFEKDYVKSGRVNSFVNKSLASIKKAKQDYDKDKLTQTEVNSVLKEIRNVLSEIKIYREKNIISELTKKKITIQYGEGQRAELFNYDDMIYILFEDVVYEFKEGKFVETSKKSDEFKSPSKYASIQLSEELFKQIKKVLGTDEIFV